MHADRHPDTKCHRVCSHQCSAERNIPFLPESSRLNNHFFFWGIKFALQHFFLGSFSFSVHVHFLLQTFTLKEDKNPNSLSILKIQNYRTKTQNCPTNRFKSFYFQESPLPPKKANRSFFNKQNLEIFITNQNVKYDPPVPPPLNK